MTRNDIARRLARLESRTAKPGGIDWAAIMAKAATMPLIHSPYWQNPEARKQVLSSGPRIRRHGKRTRYLGADVLS